MSLLIISINYNILEKYLTLFAYTLKIQKKITVSSAYDELVFGKIKKLWYQRKVLLNNLQYV
jgi:hypothetical protein